MGLYEKIKKTRVNPIQALCAEIDKINLAQGINKKEESAKPKNKK